MIDMLSIFTSLLLVSPAASAVVTRQSDAPTAKTKNGTYYGVYNPSYDTDYFLGMRFAQPPVGDLRLRVPQPLNSSWSDSRNATEFGYQCIGYGRDTWSQGNYVSEDCLTLNVVRPHKAAVSMQKLLPVLVWIHGGGLVMGGGSDRRYNQSFIVQQSVEAGMPIIAVSINYRLASWGFLYGKEIQESGDTMLGFRDQRLALHWIQENIEAFGGDPAKVTIQGESAGAGSVAAHLIAYNGRDDGLFSGVIGQSGNIASLGALPTVEEWEPVIKNISTAAGCTSDTSVLECLRPMSTGDLNRVFNSSATSGAGYGTLIDNDFIVAPPSVQLEEGNFVHVPYIIGSNSDEGTSFGSSEPINTDEEFLDYITSQGYDNATANALAERYPDIPELGVPSTLEGRPNETIGLQYKRASALATDTSFTAGRRLSCQIWAKYGVPAYSYRFNVLVNGLSHILGSIHFQEVAFTFFNTEGLGYPQNGGPNPVGGPMHEEYVRLARLMSRMWVSFVNFGEPNKMLGVEAETWPAYTLEEPQNFVFEQNVTSHAEPDTYRKEGIQYLIDLIFARAGTDCPGLEACRANDA